MNMENTTPKRRTSRGDDYVNNKEFSAAVSQYVMDVKRETSDGRERPQITNYIAVCLLKIANGLSRSPNFVNYSYREDMVMDAVENCIKAVNNYNIDSPTRTGTPNAFSYFTQISYFAFLRRIAKENKQSDIKRSLIEKGGISNFADFDDQDMKIGETLIEKVRQRNDAFYDDRKGNSDEYDKVKLSKPATKRAAKVAKAGPLSMFIFDEEL